MTVDVFFDFATDANYDVESDSYDGTPTKIELLSGVYAQGVRPKKQFPGQYFNQLFSKLGTAAIVGANTDTTYTPIAAQTVVRVTSAVTANRAYQLAAAARINQRVTVFCDVGFTHEVTVKDQAGTAMVVLGNTFTSDGQWCSFIWDGSAWGVLSSIQGARRPMVEPGSFTTPSDLTALTNPPDKTTRHVAGYGLYIYRAAFDDISNPSDGLLIVDGHGDVGKWLKVDYALATMRLVATDTQYLTGSPVDMSSPTLNSDDPAARNAGTSVGTRLLTCSPTFHLRIGDVIRVSYSVSFYLWDGSGAVTSDLVVGVGHRLPAGAAHAYYNETIDRAAQNSGALNLGIAYTQGGPTKDPLRINISRTIEHRVGLELVTNPEDAVFDLVAATDAHPLGKILQGTMLSVSQYRTAL